MKKYIFITDCIRTIGGMQLYIAGKATYLRENGWQVFVFFPEMDVPGFQVECLSNFENGGIWGLWRPPFQWGRLLSRFVLRRMLSVVGQSDQDDRVIVESNTSSAAQWGELLASSLSGRHICLLCNETFRGEGKTYEEAISLFKYKLDRRELRGISPKSIPMLFDGYLSLPESEELTFQAVEQCPIQDVPEPRLGECKGYDFVICHFGRAEKDYVGVMLKDVGKFVRLRSDLRVLFILIGDSSSRREEIEDHLRPLTNLKVLELGDMFPVPREVFRLSDAVIASSGSAAYAAAEGVPTIVANIEDNYSNGILGIDTTDIFYRGDSYSRCGFDVALGRIADGFVDRKPFFAFDYIKNPGSFYRCQIEIAESLSAESKFDLEMLFCGKVSISDRCKSLVNLLRNKRLT